MRDDLEKLIRDTSLVTLALAIGFGWSLYQLAHGIAGTLDALTAHLPPNTSNPGYIGVGAYGGGVTWISGRRIITLDGILQGLIELAAVTLVAVLVQRRRARTAA
ncbi:MAG TPA: hypothetical protein VFW85_07770 [Gaiellaceae bacterium]|nr:hypothetical protein [Gaiellaceae bacterium]